MIAVAAGRSLPGLRMNAGGLLEWSIPERANVASLVAAQPRAELALRYLLTDGTERRYTFGELADATARLASLLQARGVRAGDRIAVASFAHPHAAFAHLACYRLGAISVALSPMLGERTMLERLEDVGAVLVVAQPSVRERLDGRIDLPIIETGAALERAIKDARPWTETVQTRANDPCLIIFTSGTSGGAKGAVHPHRCVYGRIPGLFFAHGGRLERGRGFWSPAEWTWIGGWLDSVVGPWLFGMHVVLEERVGKFDPERALASVARCAPAAAFVPPTALRMMRAVATPHTAAGFSLETIHSGGETLTADLVEWGASLGCTINEIYGQTEAGFIAGNAAPHQPVKDGSLGRAYPGHEIAIVDDSGGPVVRGVEGEIALRVDGDPTHFLGYWQPGRGLSAAPAVGFHRMGDRGAMDEEGYLRFFGRVDDVIGSSGYRIGPEEIEAALRRHPAVGDAAAIGSPDAVRGEVVKAYVELKPSVSPGDDLVRALQDFVRRDLAAYEYPRKIEFVDALPRTETGKVQRAVLRMRDREALATRKDVP